MVHLGGERRPLFLRRFAVFGRLFRLHASFEQLRIQSDGDYERVPSAVEQGLLYRDSESCKLLPSRDITRDLGKAVQLNLGFGGSGALQYHIHNWSATFEYGGKFRNEHKYADTYVLTLTPNGTVGLSQFPNVMINPNYYNGGDYQLGYNASLEDVLGVCQLQPDRL